MKQNYRKIVWLVFAICLFVGNQAIGAGKAVDIHLPVSMSLVEFLKTAMTPAGLTQKEKLARVKALADKKITVILPDKLGSFTGWFEPDRTYQIYYKNNRYYEKNVKYTGNLEINHDGPSQFWNLPQDLLIKSIKADPDMNLVKLGAWGNRHILDYYRLECKGRLPAVLYWEPVNGEGGGPMIVRDLTFSYSMPTDKKALKKFMEGDE